MKKNNILLIIALVILLTITLITVAYVVNEHIRDTQISTFKQFVTDHNYTLHAVEGIDYFTNITTLDLSSFEQKCITILSEKNYGYPEYILDQHTNTWLNLPQEKFAIVDWGTRALYQWIV